jgi:hypothetical protein
MKGSSLSTAQTWEEDTFEDFIDGTLDASGNNIYVSRDGRIRTIHRFDYNNDSYIDLLFCQTHNSINIIPATLARVSNDREIFETDLAVEGSLQTTAADLNHDGHQDLIFCPNHKGIQSTRRFVTIIYGGEDGWPAHRSTGALPVQDMKAVAIADLNQDGWEDIVTLNGEAWTPGQPSGNIVRIFWGGNRGFTSTRFYDLGIPGAIGITSGDFDEDGSADLAILNENHSIIIYWSDTAKKGNIVPDTSSIHLPAAQASSIASGDINNNNSIDLLVGTAEDTLYIITGQKDHSWGEPQALKSMNSSNIVVGDIDKDGYNDILLSYFSQTRAAMGEFGGATEGSGEAAQILWGSRNGFQPESSTSLEAKHLSAAAFGDFDGDGDNDVAIAINRSDIDFETQSIIYYGQGNRQFVKGGAGITTIGAFHVLAVKEKNSHKAKAIFSNSMGGRISEKVPLYLYWGSPDGFSEKNRTDIPFRSGYEATAADFNADGNTDLAVMDEMHGGQSLDEDPWAGANIFWGEAGGIDFNKGKRTVLTESFLGSSNTADLNKDGYLDLVLGQYIKDDFESNVIIYYGGKDEFTRESRVTIPCPGRSLSIQLADYDKDGWLDIGANSYNDVGIRIFYGSKKGFDVENRTELDAPAVCDNETADLNGDGWLDIIACCYNDIANNGHHDMGIFIFWGSSAGFNHSNAQWLPGITPLGSVVADFDDDGYLDIFNPHYHADLTRELLPCYLYWGGPEGYRIRNRTALINNSGSDGFAADFDKDGKLDLAVANHTVDGNHNTFSKIYYNDGKRFQDARIETIPTHGPHWSHNEDMGHIYDRSWRQFYESSVFAWNKSRRQGNISFLASIHDGTQLIFETRASANRTGLPEKKWKQTDDSGNFEVATEDRFLQYRAVLISDNGDRFPVIDKVEINLNK